MNVALVVNPRAGGGRARRIGDDIARELKSRQLEFTLVKENSIEKTIQSIRHLHEVSNISAIMSVGGDGLAHLLFPLAIEFSLPIFVVPAGTGNDFARTVGTHGLGTTQMVDLMTTQHPTLIDMGLIFHAKDRIWFGQVLSTGFDSVVNERANSFTRVKGKMKYLLAIARELPFFVPRTYLLEMDDKVFETDAMLVAIANGTSYGGGMQVCPDASQVDGAFDVLVLKPVPLSVFLRVFPRVFKGTHISHPAVNIYRCKKISLNSKAVAYADGERIGDLPISAEIVPQAMSTWTL